MGFKEVSLLHYFLTMYKQLQGAEKYMCMHLIENFQDFILFNLPFDHLTLWHLLSNHTFLSTKLDFECSFPSFKYQICQNKKTSFC